MTSDSNAELHPSRVHVERDGAGVRVVDSDGKPIATCAGFLERLSLRGLSAFTVEAYAYDLALIHRWLLADSISFEQISADELYRFLAWERGRESHPRSINRRLQTLRLYYRFVFSRALPGSTEEVGQLRRSRRDRVLGLQQVPIAPLRSLRVKEPKTIVDPLTIEQVRELLAALRRYRDLCIAHLMLLCGLRSRETLQLRLGDIDAEDRRIRVSGKGRKERVVPLPLLLLDLLRRYQTLERPKACTTDRLFVVLQGKRRGHPMTRSGLRRVFRTRRRRQALANANPHRLRHTFGTDMARSGVRLPILQRMMGHAYAETTLRYVNLSLVDVAAEFNRAVKLLQTRYHDAKDDP